jgi:hypothetical protein
MTNNAAFDASIPVLTEVFQDHPIAQEVKPPVDAPAPVAHDTHAELLESRAIGAWTGPEWDQLERRLSERILHQLQTRVDFVLEQRLCDIVHEAMQVAMGGLIDEIRHSLQQTVETIVVQVVTQELAHLQSVKK